MPNIFIITAASCSTGAVRLSGGRNLIGYTSGRVEICYNGNWGTVCRDHWSNHNNARVTCRQLRLPTNGALVLVSAPHVSYQRIWLDNVQCTGTEARLSECLANPVGTHNCDHRKDVEVGCGENMHRITHSLHIINYLNVLAYSVILL